MELPYSSEDLSDMTIQKIKAHGNDMSEDQNTWVCLVIVCNSIIYSIYYKTM